MRVLVSALSCNPLVGSEALVGYKYAEALARRHTVTVLASPPSKSPAGTKLYSVDAGACNFNDVEPAPLVRFEVRQLHRAWSLHRKLRFELVHRVTPSWIGNATALGALKVPLVIGPLLASDRPPESFAPYLRRAASRRSMCKLHPRRLAAGLARRARDWLADRQVHLAPARKILLGNRAAFDQVPPRLRSKCEQITYAGVEHDFFVPPPARLGGEPMQLLYVGRLVSYKGLELLLRAIAIAARRCDFHLRVVGDDAGDYSGYCQSLARELGLASNVEFLGCVPRARLRDFYQEADIFCFPTLCDTYGISLLEAMSCGCAVVASDVAGPREIVADGTGLKVPLRDPKQYIAEFSEALVALARDAVLRLGLGRAARDHILNHHDWHSIAGSLLQVYERL
jgi:glycosyltransferase involved in cell wall biosynthesis